MKKSVNLIIKSKLEAPLVSKFKIYLPILAAVSFLLFSFLFFGSLIYIGNNLKEYDLLKKDIETTEGKIVAQKNLEGIYNITVAKLAALEQVLSQKKSFNKVLEEINYLGQHGTATSSANIDSDGNISFPVSASSSAQVDDIVDMLLLEEQKKLFSNIQAQGFVKDKLGNYQFNISMKGDPSLLR